MTIRQLHSKPAHPDLPKLTDKYNRAIDAVFCLYRIRPQIELARLTDFDDMLAVTEDYARTIDNEILKIKNK